MGAPDRRGVMINYFRGMGALQGLLSEGIAAFAPHLLYTLAMDEHNAEDRAFGINCDLAWMSSATRVILFTPCGTEASMTSGVRNDMDRANQLNDRWARLAARIDAETMETAAGLIRRGLPVEFRKFPEAPAQIQVPWIMEEAMLSLVPTV
jgi:hypothetical protein